MSRQTRMRPDIVSVAYSDCSYRITVKKNRAKKTWVEVWGRPIGESDAELRLLVASRPNETVVALTIPAAQTVYWLLRLRFMDTRWDAVESKWSEIIVADQHTVTKHTVPAVAVLCAADRAEVLREVAWRPRTTT